MVQIYNVMNGLCKEIRDLKISHVFLYFLTLIRIRIHNKIFLIDNRQTPLHFFSVLVKIEVNKVTSSFCSPYSRAFFKSKMLYCHVKK